MLYRIFDLLSFSCINGSTFFYIIKIDSDLKNSKNYYYYSDSHKLHNVQAQAVLEILFNTQTCPNLQVSIACEKERIKPDL